jgi:alkyldihydroxyacetonephosphate synthase
MKSVQRRRCFWGWGFDDEGPDAAELAIVQAGLGSLLGMEHIERTAPPRLDEIELRPPRAKPPTSLAPLFSDAPEDRAAHSYGKSYRDLVRALRRDFSNPPDCVAFPQSEADVVRILDFCATARLAVIPYGGGSSVCGGVEPAVGESFHGTVSLDLGRLNRVLEIDKSSRAAKIQAGVLGPALEGQLRPAGLTLRHYPQSFEFSSLGGWIATRSGGHFATLYTHIDELVEGLRIVTPTGTVETRRLPGDGAGPSPERLFIGSEGIFGVIVEAWMRLFDRPRFRASLAASFGDFHTGARAVKTLAQSGLYPANCRLLDPLEALMNGAGSGDRAVLIVAFESADHSLESWLLRAAQLCQDAGGVVSEQRARSQDSARRAQGAADAWRSAFIRAPYLRDELVLRGIFVETFETAVTWDRFEGLHAAVMRAAREAIGATDRSALVTCRLTHAYPDGAAPYFTVITPARRGAELAQWDEVKCAITNAMLDHGGTVTHHHAVGRDVRTFYEKQRPPEFARALGAVKRELDPAGIMNPGVLL